MTGAGKAFGGSLIVPGPLTEYGGGTDGKRLTANGFEILHGQRIIGACQQRGGRPDKMLQRLLASGGIGLAA